MGRIIAIANQKGGVGKTTTSVNLAASLAAQNRRVLLVDMDPQGNAGSGLGIMPSPDEPTIYQVLMDKVSMLQVARDTEVPGLSIVPSNTQLIGAEVELVSTLARETHLRRALEPIKDNYDLIIMDCPPAVGLLTVNALTAANGVIIPLQCEYYALEGLSHLLETIRLVQGSLNAGLEIDGILLTMFDARNNLCHQVVTEARQHFPNVVFNTIIPRNVRLSEAPSHAKPVILYDVVSRGAQAYLALAEELQVRLGMGEASAEKACVESPGQMDDPQDVVVEA